MMEQSRIAPQATDIEVELLCSMINVPDILDICVEGLSQDTDIFYSTMNRTIYRAVLDLYNANKQVDPVLVIQQLRKIELLEQAGGEERVYSVCSQQGLTERLVNQYIDILWEKKLKRDAILMANQITAKAFDESTSAEEVISEINSVSSNLGKQFYNETGAHSKDIIYDALQYAEQRMENPGLSGAPTGTPLDKYTNGYQDGSLYIIGARPSVGKSAFIFKNAFYAASLNSDHRRKPFVWNGEMVNRDILLRQMALESRVNFTKIRSGSLTKDEMDELVKAGERLYNSDLFIEDTPGIGIYELSAKYKAKVKGGYNMLFVDYLQLMSGYKEGNREQEISSISRGLKALAKETNTPVIACSQLSRECLKRPGAQPKLDDLRESGTLEQDADCVIFLNRPELFGYQEYKGQSTKGIGYVDVAKNRNGMLGSFKMDFISHFAEWRTQQPSGDQRKTGIQSSEGAAMPYSLPLDDDDQPF